MTVNLVQRLVAEMVGTALLVTFGAGSFVAALLVGSGQVDYAGIGIIALSFALVVAAVIYMFGSTSGAHINPAVTLALAVVRRFPWAEVVPYIVAQLVGAVVGGILVDGMFGRVATGLNVSGGTVVSAGFSNWQALLAEFLGTALLMLTIMAVAIDRRAPVGFAGLMIGLAVGCEIMVIGPISNGSVNPARTFGPYVATQIFGGSTPWSLYWIYVVGPVVGAAAGALLYDVIAAPRRAEAAAERRAVAAEAAPEPVQGRAGAPPEPREASPHETAAREGVQGRTGPTQRRQE